MRVAILIDTLIAKGGGERIAYILAKKYNADIFTTALETSKIAEEFKEVGAIINLIDSGMKRAISSVPILKQEQLIRLWSSLDLSKYDAIISMGLASYCQYASVKNPRVAWYAFTLSPLFYPKNIPEGKWTKNRLFERPFLWAWKKRLERYDKKVINANLNKFVTLSRYSYRFLLDYYGRRPDYVIAPPVECNKYYWNESEGYYLMVDRLVVRKRLELAIEAFKRMPNKKLIITGDGFLEPQIRELANGARNIHIIHQVSTSKLRELYSKCIALISTAQYQEWSMVAIEALASGKPIIMVNQGNYPYMVRQRKTGLLFDDNSKDLARAVGYIDTETARKMKATCIKEAKKYDVQEFYKKWDVVLQSMTKK